ncbi:ring-1,2-phenylacetyl-CoA epoxidase subunit PaaE [Kineococcus xinjiangensis]|uniref:Ring-1,2-phenylacetyl-CoA epoxidase subunit PaaE n=1 Tax=Kineococcus xinjiangensis TaxID=512762 RepID=A0A2S6IK89_9ACTN|nr:1,2-phenylacetyl-CoA epoxidase subunit PaaE [Kineococcus xinjiangensis]PPK94591.1 ring-1,2-phenylacetyl-CoA epoxidase subunit PaaE [Kineococcus xinjiangensis]
MPATFHPLRVREVERLTDDAVAISFDVPEHLRAAYEFRPGQHLTLRRVVDGKEARRSYSICAPAGSGRLRVAVKRIDGGAFSGWATRELRPGDEVDVMTPAGRFGTTFEPQRASSYVAIAAGSGITPVLSLLATGLEVERGSRFTLVYGNRSSATVMFLDELADLKDRHPERLQVLHVLSRESQDAPLLSGRIDAEKLRTLLGSLLRPEDVDAWFLCGPEEMVAECRRVLDASGVPAASVHRELFHVAGAEPVLRPTRDRDAARGAGSSVTVLLDGRSTTLDLAVEDEPVLDAVLRVRPDAPFACKGGVCGTCRARVLEGSVRMEHDYALEEYEKEAGYVLACQSHPTSDRVVLDFDQ